jgi:multiple sugar transport system permease protein
VATVGKYLVKLVWAILVLIPFALALSAALKANESVYSLPYKWIPGQPSLGNFEFLLIQFKVWRYLFNSFTITALTIALQAIVCSLAGYAFGRLKFRWRDQIFLACLFIMMIPYTTVIIPLFIMMLRFGWIDTYLPLVVPQSLTYAYGVFIFRQFSTAIPVSLDESAYIDGATYGQIYARIIVPLLRPGFVSVAILGGIAAWNDFLGPLVFLQSQKLYTMQLALRFFTGQFTSDYTKLMAAVVIAIVPIMMIYFVFQRQFISSYMRAGLKG